MKKKILTLDDLVAFCQSGKIKSFSSKESGYQLCVHTPSTLKYANDVEETDSTLFAYVKLFHVGKNRNKSSVTEEAAKRSLDSIKYKPILANFTDNTEDGELDFTEHDIDIDDDGNLIYLEKQVGSFTADEPYLEYDKTEKKKFVFAKMAIPKEYTPTAEILKRKGGTKVSVELMVNEMSYNSKKRLLELTDIEVRGCTLLGVNPETGKPVEEGMKGAKASLTDFSASNNSVFKQDNETLIKMLGDLNETLSGYFNSQAQKGGKSTMGKFEELLKKYGVTEEDVNFDYKNMTDEELESSFIAAFDEGAGEETDDGGIEDVTEQNEEVPEEETVVPLDDGVSEQEGGEEDVLEGEPANTEQLQASIDSTEDLTSSDYTTSSWEALQSALEAANVFISTPGTDQGAVDQAKQNLDNAIAALVNIKSLNESIQSTTSLVEDDYSVTTWEALQTALQAAEAAKIKPNVTQGEINSAKEGVDNAIIALVSVKDLKASIASVSSLKEKDYSEETWEKLQEALEAANTALESPSFDQEDINTAKTNLDAAIKGLKAPTVVPDDDDETTERKRRKKVSANSLKDRKIEFELSHEDIRSALYYLLSAYEEEENEAYSIVKVYEDKFIFQSWFTGSFYGQKYQSENDEVSFDGDKYPVFLEFLTEDEVSSLNKLRTENMSLKESLNKFQKEADDKSKDSILSDVSYQKYLSEPEFKQLVKDKDKYSVEEFNIQAEVAFAKCVKRFSFAHSSTRKVIFSAEDKGKKKPYGNIFK